MLIDIIESSNPHDKPLVFLVQVTEPTTNVVLLDNYRVQAFIPPQFKSETSQKFALKHLLIERWRFRLNKAHQQDIAFLSGFFDSQGQEFIKNMLIKKVG